MAAQTETGTHMLCTAMPELHITGVILAVIRGKSPAGVYCSCGSSIRLSVILKGRPVSSEPSQPQPGRGSRYCPMTLSCCGGFPGPQCQPTGRRTLCVRFRYPPGCRHHPDRAGAGTVIILNINGRMAAAPYTLSSETYRQPLFSGRSPSRRTKP